MLQQAASVQLDLCRQTIKPLIQFCVHGMDEPSDAEVSRPPNIEPHYDCLDELAQLDEVLEVGTAERLVRRIVDNFLVLSRLRLPYLIVFRITDNVTRRDRLVRFECRRAPGAQANYLIPCEC